MDTLDEIKRNGQPQIKYNLQDGKPVEGDYEEMGTPGISAFGGYITQAYNAKLHWPSAEPLYSRIWRSDAETTIVRTIFSALTGQQSLEWTLPETIGGRDLGPPNDADNRMLEFAHTLTEDIRGGLHRWLTECNARTSFFGFGVWEMPLGLRQEGWHPPDSQWESKFTDGLVGIRDVAFRDYSSFVRWEMDDYTGHVDGFVQHDSPNPMITIPMDRLLHITYGGSTNPEGLATMEALWRLERVLFRYQFIHGTGSEHAAGHLKVKVKEELNAEARAEVRRFARAIMSAQEGNYATEIEDKFEFAIIDTPFQAAPAVLDAMRYYSLLKLALYGMQFAGMNTLSDTGSYSALQDSSSMALLLFNAMSEGFTKQASEQITQRVFGNPINQAAFAGATRQPVLTVSKIEKVYGLDELGAFTQALATVFPLGEDDAIAIRRKSGVLPETLPEDATVIPDGEEGSDTGVGAIADSPENLESTAGLNGAQITAVLKVLDGLAAGSMPEQAAIELLVSVGMRRERAETIVKETLKSGKVGISNPNGNQPASDELDMSLWWRLRQDIYSKPRPNAADLITRLEDITTNEELVELMGFINGD